MKNDGAAQNKKIKNFVYNQMWVCSRGSHDLFITLNSQMFKFVDDNCFLFLATTRQSTRVSITIQQ